MPKLVILGTSNAIPDEEHENTHMAVVGRHRTLLIDCVNSPLLRLRQGGIDFNQVTDLVVTHFHPDHVSGVPSLLMNMWLLGRQEEINIYGLAYTLERLEKLMEFYNWSTWPNFYSVNFHVLPEQEKAPVMDSEEFRVFASPVRHLIPTIGLRIEFPESQKALAYSCDTEPCGEVVRLAAGADVLIHEATGDSLGHTSASSAGAIARRAEVGILYLIHYPTIDSQTGSLVSEAESSFGGQVVLAQDFMELAF
jgi:ribonuclease Z